ncbi:tetratricopeptide repeat protein [uncultured Aquimarina sp.]|uniref:tetratricopeptide repeat protein n=1 Tax=uncultured Aquimarina sp. TaxID=575652 RepID=UPI00260D2773|nr:tetratricopeptide repeat protein [uncultured Aquimarina sp.]
MNKSILWGLLCIVLTYSHTSSAQDCAEKITVAKDYMEIVQYLSPEFKERLRQSILPCVHNGTPDAIFIEAVLALSNNPTEEQKVSAFKTIKQCAESGDIAAYNELAVIYKEGIGTDVNLEKSYKWFEKASDDGDSFANYALGYFQLKGLGGAKQDYSGAQDWFQSSDYPMAEHWFAVQRYFGYGITANQSHALQILDAIPIKNSEILATFLRSNQNTTLPSITSQELNLINSFDNNIENITFPDINKRFEAKIVELDWKKEKVKRVEDISFDFAVTGSGLTYNITIAGTTLQGNATYGAENTMTLEGVSFPVKRLYKDSGEDEITYNIKEVKFDLLPVGDITYVVGNINATIVDFKEPSPPLYIILKPAPEPEPEPTVAEINSISPNPTSGSFTVHYFKPEQANSYLTLRQNGPELARTPTNTKKGNFQHTFDDLLFYPSGIYYVQLFVNGVGVDSKQVVKQ